MENAQSVYERYITVDEMIACLVLGVDIKHVMADKYIEMYLEYVKVSGGGEKRGGCVERIWCSGIGGGSGGSRDAAPIMTFPEWMVWYERAVFRSKSSYVNMMNGIRDLGIRMDRVWRTGERYADEIYGGMTGEERQNMIEIYKVAAGLFGFFNVTNRSRRFEECVSLRRPLTWYLVWVDLCSHFVWYNRWSLMHEVWGIPWHGIERFYGVEVPRQRPVGRDGRHHGCDVLYVPASSSSDDDGETSVGGESSATTVKYNGDNVSVEYISSDVDSDGVSIEF